MATKTDFTVDLDEVAPYEPPHQDLHCLQIQLLSFLVVKELVKLKQLPNGAWIPPASAISLCIKKL